MGFQTAASPRRPGAVTELRHPPVPFLKIVRLAAEIQ
jgi:hypothetical protein